MPKGTSASGSWLQCPGRALRSSGMTMTQQDLDEQVQTLGLINNEMEARLARQSDSIGEVDTKAVVVVGFVATAA